MTTHVLLNFNLVNVLHEEKRRDSNTFDKLRINQEILFDEE